MSRWPWLEDKGIEFIVQLRCTNGLALSDDPKVFINELTFKHTVFPGNDFETLQLRAQSILWDIVHRHVYLAQMSVSMLLETGEELRLDPDVDILEAVDNHDMAVEKFKLTADTDYLFEYTAGRDYLTLYFAEVSGEVHGPVCFVPHQRVERIEKFLEEGTFKSKCIDEETRERLAYAQIMTKCGNVLEGCRNLDEYPVHHRDTLTVILVPSENPSELKTEWWERLAWVD